MNYPGIPCFQKGDTLEEKHLYQLGRLSVESARIVLLASGIRGFLRPPFCPSDAVPNEIDLDEEKQIAKVSNVFAISSNGYPFIVEDKLSSDSRGENRNCLVLSLNLPENFDTRHPPRLFWTNDDEVRLGDEATTKRICLGRFDREGEFTIIPPPVTIDAHAMTDESFPKLKERVKALTVAIIGNATRLHCVKTGSMDMYLYQFDEFDTVCSSATFREIIHRLANLSKALNRVCQTLYFERHLSNRWSDCRNLSGKSLEFRIERRMEKEIPNIVPGFRDLLVSMGKSADKIKKIATTSDLTALFDRMGADIDKMAKLCVPSDEADGLPVLHFEEKPMAASKLWIYDIGRAPSVEIVLTEKPVSGSVWYYAFEMEQELKPIEFDESAPECKAICRNESRSAIFILERPNADENIDFEVYGKTV